MSGRHAPPTSVRALSAVEHRPADVVAQPLIVDDELANRLRELVALPPALESPCALALPFRRGSTCGLDRIGCRTEVVRGDVCDGGGLGGSVCGMPRCPTQVSGCGVCMARRRASPGHGDLAARPCACPLDRLTRSRVLRLSRLEEVKDVLRARCRPQGEELVIGIGEGPTAADRHETRVAVFREDHIQHPFCSHLANVIHDAPAPSCSPTLKGRGFRNANHEGTLKSSRISLCTSPTTHRVKTGCGAPWRTRSAKERLADEDSRNYERRTKHSREDTPLQRWREISSPEVGQ